MIKKTHITVYFKSAIILDGFSRYRFTSLLKRATVAPSITRWSAAHENFTTLAAQTCQYEKLVINFWPAMSHKCPAGEDANIQPSSCVFSCKITQWSQQMLICQILKARHHSQVSGNLIYILGRMFIEATNSDESHRKKSFWSNLHFPAYQIEAV